MRTPFTEFKHRIQLLEDADDRELQGLQKAVEIAWRDLIYAVETLLAAVS